MIKHLPEWIMKRYAKLWNKFKDKEFTKEQAMNVLPKDSSLAVLLSELRKAEWMEIQLSQEDARKTIYKLKDPTKTFLQNLKEIAKK